MRHIDLFSGIGGFALASSWVWGSEYENVGHSEIEKYACKVYHRHFPNSRCLGDITKIEWQEGQADLITGGFPCQPHSVAGKRKGQEDERDLWGECVRAVRMVRPRYALFENVPGLFTSNGGRFFRRVLGDLAEIGYDAEWSVVSAASVGAPHLRERVWIVAYPGGAGIGNQSGGFDVRGRITPEARRETIRQEGAECTIRTGATSSPLAYPNTGRRSPDLRETLPRRQGEAEPDPESCGRSERGEAVSVPNSDEAGFQEEGAEQQAAGITRESGETLQDPIGLGCVHGQSQEAGADIRQQRESGAGSGERILGEGETLANATNKRQTGGGIEAGGKRKERRGRISTPGGGGWWSTEPDMGLLADGLSVGLDVARHSEFIRVAKGIPKRADQLKGLGNAIVPQVAYEILKRIKYSVPRPVGAEKEGK